MNRQNGNSGDGLNGLAELIRNLESRYITVPEEKREIGFVANTLQEWIGYKQQLNTMRTRGLGREIRHYETFLLNVQVDFHQGMNKIMQEYNNHKGPITREFVQNYLEMATKYLNLYRQAGLRGFGLDKDVSIHAAYTQFERNVKEDLAMFPQSVPKKGVFNGDMNILNQTFPLALTTSDDEAVYWSFASPDSLQRPTGKKLKDFHRPDIAQVCAEAYILRLKVSGESVNAIPSSLAESLLRNRLAAIDEIHGKVLQYKKSSQYPNSPTAR